VKPTYCTNLQCKFCNLLQEAKSNNGSQKKKPERSKESFEAVPLYTAMMTYLGFYLLMFLGYINQLFFTPKVAMERNRDVSILMSFGWLVLCEFQCKEFQIDWA
jgi:hypothetical protein